MIDSKNRFTGKANNYAKHRPSYPKEAVDIICENINDPNGLIADIGSGTGKLTKLLLKRNLNVVGIEPNDDMREKSEKELSKYITFTTLKASAEKTNLSNHSISLITAANAFHHFDIEKALIEFKRILIPNGKVALIWNFKDTEKYKFMEEYVDITRLLSKRKPTFAKEKMIQEFI